MEKDGACKMDRQNKKCSCVKKSGRRKNNAGTDKEEKNRLCHWLRKNCQLKDAPEGMVNVKKVRGRRRYQMIDNIMIYGLYEVCTSNSGTNAAVLLKDRFSSTANSGTKVAVLVGINRCGSFPFLSVPHSLFSI